MANRIQLRRDTAQNWASNNPVLFEGEFGVELDTRKIKMGNGSNAWNDLLYSNITPDELSALLPSAVQNFSIDQNGNLVADNPNGIYLKSSNIMFNNNESYGTMRFFPSDQTIQFRSGNTTNQVGSLSFDDVNMNLYANQILNLTAQGGPVQISSYNSDIILSPDGFAYLADNQSYTNRIATLGNLDTKADLDSNGQVPISQLGNALGGVSTPIHPFAMLG